MDVKEMELAFENGVADSCADLWRVVSMRTWNHREFRHTNFFSSEDVAMKHAHWIGDGRGRVISITHYRIVPPEKAKGAR